MDNSIIVPSLVMEDSLGCLVKEYFLSTASLVSLRLNTLVPDTFVLTDNLDLHLT